MGRKKSFYKDDLGLSIRHKMRELDLADYEPEEEHMLGSQLPADQEDEEWEAKLYEP
jgi:hypothetical protein